MDQFCANATESAQSASVRRCSNAETMNGSQRVPCDALSVVLVLAAGLLQTAAVPLALLPFDVAEGSLQRCVLLPPFRLPKTPILFFPILSHFKQFLCQCFCLGGTHGQHGAFINSSQHRTGCLFQRHWHSLRNWRPWLASAVHNHLLAFGQQGWPFLRFSKPAKI